MSNPPLTKVLARNVEYLAFCRGWTRPQLTDALGISPHVMSRLRRAEGRFIDAELLESCLRVFDCTPNDLLIPHPELVYDLDA